MLHSSPSFSIYHSGDEFQDLEGRDPSQEALERTITIGESLEAIGSGEFSFNKKSMSLIVEREEEKDEVVDGIQSGSVEEEANEPPSPPLYLATGLGIDTSGFGVGGGRGFDEFNLAVANFDDGGDVEEYCKRMVDEYPCHPLFLRKYAQVLQVSLLCLVLLLFSWFVNLLKLHKNLRKYILQEIGSTNNCEY